MFLLIVAINFYFKRVWNMQGNIVTFTTLLEWRALSRTD